MRRFGASVALDLSFLSFRSFHACRYEIRRAGSDPRSSGERDKALNLVLGQIERNFGKGSIMRLGDASRMRVETISTGALTLDLALGWWLPQGRVVEIYGPESSGKTTLTLHAIAEVQKRGGVAAFVDAEHALDPGLRRFARAWMWRTCWCLSRIPARWRWRSLISWCVPLRSTGRCRLGGRSDAPGRDRR